MYLTVLRFALVLGLAALTVASPAQAIDPRVVKANDAIQADDYTRAAQILIPAAKEGVADAQYLLGLMYRDGLGVTKDPRQAVDLLGKAAASGRANAQYNLGLILYEGRGVPADPKAGFQYLQQAAEQGYIDAQTLTGAIQTFSEGPFRDTVSGIQYLRKAAEKMSPEALYYLGLAYDRGTGTEKNASEAVRLYAKAAALGEIFAQVNLGLALLEGNGIATNPSQGAQWMRRAADAGNAMAQRNLGLLLNQGRGVNKDDLESYKYLKLSAAKGDEGGIKLLNEIRGYLSPDQILEGERRAVAFKPSAPWRGSTPTPASHQATASPHQQSDLATVTRTEAPTNPTTSEPGEAAPPDLTKVSAPVPAFPVHPVELNVETYRGSLRIRQPDVRFEGSPLPLGVVRYFNSAARVSGPLGPGWSHDYETSVTPGESNDLLLLFEPGGRVTPFRRAQGDLFTAPREGATLNRAANGFLLKRCTGERRRFDAAGRLVRIEEPGGQAIELTYLGGLLRRAAGPFGQSITFYYDNGNALVGATSSAGDKVGYVYDAEGRLTQVVLNGALAGRFTYTKTANISSATFSAERKWTVTATPSGRVTRLTDPYQYATRYEYPSTPQFAAFVTIAPNDARTTHQHWRDGSKQVVIGPDGATTITAMDPQTGLPALRTDAAGRTTAYRWDAAGRLAEVRDPAGRVTRLAYLAETPLPTRVETPDGNVVAMSYDTRLNVTRVADAQRGTQVLTYDNAGRLTMLKEFDGTETTYTYGNGWLPRSVVGQGRTVTLEYDAAGQAVAYATNGGPRQVLADLRAKTSEAATALLPRHDFSRAGQEVASSDGLIRYAFDTVGNLTHMAFPTGSRREFRYDAAGRLTQILQDGRPVLALAHDAVGNVTGRTVADGRKILIVYDVLDRPVEMTYPDGSKTTLAYDVAGRIVEARVGPVAVHATYDPRGHRTSTRLGGINAAVTFAMSDEGRTRIVRTPGGEVRYTFDERGRLTRVASAPFGEITFAYDAAGRLVQRRYPNGVVEKYTLEAPGTTRQEVLRDGKPLRSAVTLRNAKGLTIKRTVDAKEETFAYDGRGQLLQADMASGRFRYTYDAWGNRISEQAGNETVDYATMPDGRLTKRGRTTYEWDAGGNLKSRRTPEGATAFTFDAGNRLVSTTGPDGKPVAYLHDERGLPVARTAGGRTVYTLYDGLNPVADVLADGGAGRVLARYLYAPGVDEALGMVRLASPDGAETPPEVVFFHRDERNDVVLVTDAQGRAVARYAYGPFGQTIRTEGAFDSPLGFGAHRREAALGLYAMRARFYDPETGRFLSPDPVRAGPEDGLGTHPYLYVMNSPMDFTDPLGLLGLPQWVKERRAIGASNQETLASDTAKDLLMNQVTGKIESQTVMRIVPAEKLPFGVSKTVLDSSKQTLGVKIVEVPKPGAAQTADRLGAAWEVFKVTKEIHDAYTGEDDVKTAQNKIVAATVGAELSIGIGAAAKVVGAATGPVGVAVAIVGGAVANEVKTAVMEGLDAWDAKIAAQQAVNEWQENDLRLARQKTQQIREAMGKGDFAQARQLNRGLNTFATSREDSVKGMSDLAMATLDLQSDIYKAEKVAREAKETAQREREASEAKASEAKTREAEAKQLQERAQQQAAAEAAARQAAAQQAAAQQAQKSSQPPQQQPPPARPQQSTPPQMTVQPPPVPEAQGPFAISLVGPSKPIQPGEMVGWTLRISGGEPPFTVSGATSGRLQKREGTFEIVAPKAPGSYNVPISATDAAGRTASAQGTLVVGKNIVQGTCRGTLRGGSSSGAVTLTLNKSSIGGSFSGRYGKTITISGTISGTYNMATGAVAGTMSGRYTDTDPLTKPENRSGTISGSFTGSQQGSGFAGSWRGSGGYSDSGSWSAGGGTLTPMTP